MALDSTRDGFGRGLVKIAQEHDNVYAMDCDLGRSTRSYRITEVDAARFIEMGISEQDMISTAAGMSTMGKVVFVNSFAVFLTGRAYDQIRQQIALPRLNVKLCGSSAGITQGTDGATHQSVTDVNLMRGLPNMVVLCPCDSRQAEEMVLFAYNYEGPLYIRLSRYETQHIVPEEDYFELGKAQKLHEGSDIALLSYGPILENVLHAATLLESRGISCEVWNFPTIKPLNGNKLMEICENCKQIITIEEHSIIGGLGSAVAEILAESAVPIKNFLRLGLRDCFGESGSAKELLKKHQLDPDGIAKSVIQLLGSRSKE